jgi:hypothetical protein
MTKRNHSFRFLLTLVAGLVLAACANLQEPAQKAITEIESTVTAVSADAEKYVPEQYAAVTQKLADLKASFAKQDYKAVIAAGPALLADAKALGDAAAAKKKEVLEALSAQWTQLATQVPEAVSAIEARLATFKKTHSLPKGVTKDAVAGATSGLADIKTAWADATTAFTGGDVQGALDKAKAVAAKAADISAKLGIGADAGKPKG